jgi:hypothetical protein
MSTTQLSNDTVTGAAGAVAVPMRLEVVVVPVADVERAKSFYATAGTSPRRRPAGRGRSAGLIDRLRRGLRQRSTSRRCSCIDCGPGAADRRNRSAACTPRFTTRVTSSSRAAGTDARRARHRHQPRAAVARTGDEMPRISRNASNRPQTADYCPAQRRSKTPGFPAVSLSFEAFGRTTENRGVPGSSPGVATRNPHSCGIYCFSDRSGVAINGYSIGYLGRVYFELETESPVLINVRAC